LVTCAGTLVLLGVLWATVPLSPSSVVTGLVTAALGPAALVVVMRRYEVERLGPADRVTIVRAVLGTGVLTLCVAKSSDLLLAALLTVVLVLDGVDGRVARRTGTSSAFGARLDMEVDALLILVLSWQVASDAGSWVLGLGLARYLFGMVLWLTPALRFDPPPRAWCKTVAVLVAAVLATAAVGLLPARAEPLLLVVVTALLAESFAHEAVDRWRAGVRSGAGAPVLARSHG
jgi:phosphatidylglycerophosphate synthase